MWEKHPKGLPVLFFTEMWERFGFYTIIAILALYMDEYFKLPKNVSGSIYGGFIALVYFMPLFGGLIADKWLGYGRSIIIGAILAGIGYAALAVGSLKVFYVALIIIVIGNGFFKPNISTILGNLYGDNDSLKDDGFNIFYMGINIGALFAPLAAAYLRNNYGWGYAFGAAAIGMFMALIIYVMFGHRVKELVHSKSQAGEHVQHMTKEQEKNRIISLIVVFVIVVFFWMAFYQNGFTLTFWARDCTLTSIPPETFQSVNPLFIIFFTPLVVRFWNWMRRKGKEPSTAGKIAVGMFITALAYAVMAIAGIAGGDTGRVSMSWLVATYALITLAELCISPMGLSLVSKLAPPRMRGFLMGGWFVSLAAGGYLSGLCGSFWEKMSHSAFFGMLVITSLVAVALMMLAKKKVTAAMNS